MTPDTDERVSIHLYNALGTAHRQLSNVLSRHGCPQGEEMAPWLDAQLSSRRAYALGIDTWQEWSDDLTKVMKAFGYDGKLLRLQWLTEQLQELEQRRNDAS